MIKKLLKKILTKYQSILFVGSTDILPEPLSKEEEIKYVEMSMNNDKYARNKLIEHNLRLVVFLAKKYDNTGTDLEDVLGTEKDIVTKGLDDELNRHLMLEEIAKLSRRDKEIIELRYGLNKKNEMTQKDVANLLGISQSYISRIEKKVIKRLKNIIKN